MLSKSTRCWIVSTAEVSNRSSHCGLTPCSSSTFYQSTVSFLWGGWSSDRHKAGSGRGEFSTTWDFVMTGAERMNDGGGASILMCLNPTGCFSSGLGGNLLKHIKLHVATVSLLVPAAVATECKPCSQVVLFFFFARFSVLELIKACCARWGKGKITMPLAQEPVEISAATHSCCIFGHKNREVVACRVTSLTLRACLHQPAGRKAPFFLRTGTKL